MIIQKFSFKQNLNNLLVQFTCFVSKVQKMKYFIQKIKSNQRNAHFMLYCYTFFIMGAMLNGIGPLIPNMAQTFHHSQIQYSMLFPGRTAGYIIGSILTKYCIGIFTYHKLMICSAIVFTVSSISFNFCSNITWQTFYIGLNAISLAFYDIITNISLLIFNKDQDKAFWVVSAYGLFGVGSLISPIIAYFFQLNTFLCFGLLNIIMVFGYYNLTSPEINVTGQMMEELIQLNVKAQNNKEKKKKQQKLEPNSGKILVYITILYFVYAGLESSYSVWIPSYSVLAKISNKQQATVYNIMFYLSMTISRFFYAIPTKYKNMFKSKIILIVIQVTSIFGVIFHFTSPHVGCYIVSIVYGFAMAPLWSWYLVLSYQNGFQLKDSQYSSILIVSMLGPTVFPTIIGYLFEISLSMIFVSMFVMALIQLICLFRLRKQFQVQTKRIQQLQQQNKESLFNNKTL